MKNALHPNLKAVHAYYYNKTHYKNSYFLFTGLTPTYHFIYFYRFNNIVAKWPGSAHYSVIWNSSSLSINFKNGDINGWL